METPRLLQELYRIQSEVTDLDEHARLLLKMCANMLESHYQVKPQNRLTPEEYFELPGRFEMMQGMLIYHW